MSENIQISKQFVETEVTKAPPLYVCVYLLSKAKENATTEEIAKDLGILESDVIRAFAYWQDHPDVMLQPNEVEAPMPETKIEAKSEDKPEPESSGIAWAKKPEYTTDEIGMYMQHKEVKGMIQRAQQRMGRLLTRNDLETLFGFYDWLGLPVDVIDILISYCVSKQKTAMGYMEAVAIDWAKESIQTVEQAEAYIEMRNSGFGKIMRGFGQSGRAPVDGEIEYMKRWLREYKMPVEVIKIACERTVMQTGKVSYPYADRILQQWNEKGIHGLVGVEKADQAFVAKKDLEKGQKEAKQNPQGQKPDKPKNKFINYTQREWDFKKLEQLQREQRDQW
ncbi:DnaD domain protein [Chakrabartyella piscis]|uniref:DnaD domain protein n=1 Tax=Chakrabartyella piscis TaxID=2918914 RepID=UPI00295837DB|nr:DnaD domain protein [Chakrabartyella piscis]